MKYTLRDNFHWRFIRQNIIDFAESFLPFSHLTPRNKKGKRILIFNWRDTKHEFAGGAEVYIHELAKEWVQNGHHVTLFCGNDSKSLRNEAIDGVQIVRRGGFYFVYVWAFLYYLLHFRGKYDVIIDAQNGIPFFTPLYAKEPVYSLMFHVHQEVFRKSLIKPLSELASFLETYCMPRIYRSVPFLTISESSQKEMTKLGLSHKGVSIIYPGTTSRKSNGVKKSKNPTVLYLGRLKYYKRIDVLLKSVRDILKEFPDAEFVIAGDGEYRSNLKKLVKRLGIENNVTFLGRVSEKQKSLLYAKAWVVVNPSMMEGWGITTIEANAMGTTVIASDVPGLRDSVKDNYNGLLFTQGDYNELAGKIRLLFSNKSLRVRMEKNAIKWATNFTWKKSAKTCIEKITQPQKKLSLSIGVPAYNEERNIKELIYSLLAQVEEGFVLKEIVVLSDGSTDATAKRVKSIQDDRVHVFDDRQRLGKSARLNQLLDTLSSDVVLLLDADITIHNSYLLSKIFKDSDIERTGIISVKAVPHKGRNFFEKCINHSVTLQNHLRANWNHGNNYLSFRGCFVMLSQKAAKKIHLDNSIFNNDAYLYFQVKRLGFLPRYISSLSISYRSPNTFEDHIKQSSRFQASLQELEPFFHEDLSSEYIFPRALLLRATLLNFLQNPLFFIGFLFIFLRTKYTKPQNLTSIWNIALSTKSAS